MNTESNITQSSNDDRKYKYLKLDNELEVLLIQDTKTTFSCASLCVAVGSYHEKSVGIPGLAHFLEHMLFLGSSKYPKDSDYNKYIESNGGMSNAYTADDHTCYYFNINNSAFDKALDMFGQFFIAPLFNQDSLMREMNAVDSEYKKNINQDKWRQMQIMAEVAETSSPVHGFTIGNLETLNVPNIRDKVIDFYKTYYSSNLMKLVIVSPNNLDQQETLVQSIFSHVKHVNTDNKIEFITPFVTPKLIEIVPIRQEDHLLLQWQLPYFGETHLHDPYSFMSHIIGHEGPGTILDYLKTNCLGISLYSGVEMIAGNHCMFIIDIKLTKLGMNNIGVITKIVEHYIKLLLNKDNVDKLKSIYKEYQYVLNNQFTFLQISDITSYCEGLSSKWCKHKIPVNKLLSYGYSIPDYNTELYDKLSLLLNKFTNDNLFVLISSPTITKTAKLTEKYFQIKYNVHNTLDIFNFNSNLDFDRSKLSMLRQNPFICYNANVITKHEHKSNIPLLIRNDDIKVYWKLDKTFKTPHVYFSANIKFPNVTKDPKTHLTFCLVIECIKHVMNPHSYEFQIAEYLVTYYVVGDTLTIIVYGYAEKIIDVLKLILEYLQTANYDKQCFELNKTEYKQNLENIKYNPPYTRLYQTLKKVHEDKYYDENDLLNVIDTITYEDVVNIGKIMYNNVNIISMIQGNIDIYGALEMSKLLYNFPNLTPKSDICQNIIDNKNIQKIIATTDNEKNTAVAIYHKIGYYRPTNDTNEWKKIRVLSKLFDIIVGTDFYNDLRTTQQLGYIVSSGFSSVGSTECPFIVYHFTVQSDHKDNKYLQNSILTFITNYKTKLQSMTDNDLLVVKKAYIDILTDPIKTLFDMSHMNFSNIISTEQVFNVKELLVEETKKVTMIDIINYYDMYINNADIRTIIAIGK